MTRTPARCLTSFVLVLLATVAAVFALPAGSASAHNTLISSDPADGAIIAAAPVQITWIFDNPVPLDTMTVTLIDATGARSDLAGSRHGASGETEVITPLPALASGAVSLRWRLVGADGHPITGRVDFTVETAVAVTSSAPETTQPTANTSVPPSTSSAANPPPSVDDGDDTLSTPSFVRWLLRYGSYMAIMAVVGILLTAAYVWAGADTHPLLRQLLSWSLLATAALAFVQLLVVASDIAGKPPWSSFGSVDAAMTTDAGMALAIRIVLALVMWVLLFQYELVHPDVYWAAVTLPGLGLLATWAFAGHSASMRWPAVGVATDVAHHAAAAAWIGGLAIVGWVVIPTCASDVVVPAVRRFSRLATVSVAVLVVTGVVQTVRLVGNPMDLFAVDHGRYLAVKVVLLVVMLAVANINRRRIDQRLDDTDSIDRHVAPLRRAILTEFAIGMAIVAITAAMVVSPPVTA